MGRGARPGDRGGGCAARGVTPTFKHGSLLLYGEDVRHSLPLLPIEGWTRDRLHAAYYLAITVFGRPVPVPPSLDYPDPEDEFYGYARHPVRVAGGDVPSTRDLIRVTGWMATARLAHEARQYVARKRDLPALYARHIGDAWTALLVTLDRRCRTEWGYLIPADRRGRLELRAICQQVPAFENDFLARYQRYLLADLAQGQERALRVMQRLPWDDPEVQRALA